MFVGIINILSIELLTTPVLVPAAVGEMEAALVRLTRGLDLVLEMGLGRPR